MDYRRALQGKLLIPHIINPIGIPVTSYRNSIWKINCGIESIINKKQFSNPKEGAKEAVKGKRITQARQGIGSECKIYSRERTRKF